MIIKGVFMSYSSKKKEKNIFSIVYLTIIGVLLLFLLIQEWKFYQVKVAKQDSIQRIQELQKKQDELKTEVTNMQNIYYIERVARSEYKMIKSDEIPLVITDGNKPVDKPNR